MTTREEGVPVQDKATASSSPSRRRAAWGIEIPMSDASFRMTGVWA